MSTSLLASYKHMTLVQGANDVFFTDDPISNVKIFRGMSQIPEDLLDSFNDSNSYGEENIDDIFIYIPKTKTWVSSTADCWLSSGHSKMNQLHPSYTHTLCVMYSHEVAIFVKIPEDGTCGYLLNQPVADFHLTNYLDHIVDVNEDVFVFLYGVRKQ